MSKILIRGTGAIAKELIDNSVNGEVIGFVENHKTKEEFMSVPIYNVDELPNCYDYIIVANKHADEIYTTCLQR